MSYSYSTTPFFTNSETGDLQMKVSSGNAIILSEKTHTNRINITDSNIEGLGTCSADVVTLNEQDLETRINNISNTSGVGESNVTGSEIEPDSLSIEKLDTSSPLIVSGGGTGTSSFPSEQILLGRGGAIVAEPRLTVESDTVTVDGSIHINNQYAIEPFNNTLRFRKLGNGDSVLANALVGQPPTVESGTVYSGVDYTSAVDFNVTDMDGDFRKVFAKFSATSTPVPTGQDIVDNPDDWYEVNEGGAKTIYVGNDMNGPPYNEFFWDSAGTKPMTRLVGELYLNRGMSYRFEKITNNGTFFIGTDSSTPFTDFVIESTENTDYTTRITSTGQCIQFTIPDDFTGTLQHYNSTNTYKFQILDPSVSSLTDPTHDVSATMVFDTVNYQAGPQNSDYLFLVAQDASDQVGEVFGPISIDIASPVLSNFSMTATTQTTVSLEWDAVTDNVDSTPAMVISLYSSEANRSPEDVYNGTGAVTQVSIPNANTTTSYEYGAGSEGSLTGDSTHYFYAVAKDSNGLYSDVRSLKVFTISSNTAPIIGAGAALGGATYNQSSFFSIYDSSYAFDNSSFGYHSSNQGGSINNSTNPCWLSVNLGTNYVVTSYKVWNNSNGQYYDIPVDWEFQGSNNGTDWTVLDTQVNNRPPITIPSTKPNDNPHLTLAISSPQSFSHYRFYCTKTYQRNYILRIMELQLIGYVPVVASSVYPPIPLTANTDTVSGQAYGNGAYTITHTGTIAGPLYDVYKQTNFDNGNGTGFVYLQNTHPGSVTTTYPIDINVTKYVIQTADSGYASYCTNTWTVEFYNSSDGLIGTDSQTNITWTDDEIQEFSVNFSNVRKVVWICTSNNIGDGQNIYGTFVVYGSE
ncbi:putative galactose-binding domain-containing protein [Tetraselmis virus 1]|uniref:Putative galactose-binding domain-containing protein n=1 Tax=Tetraselmis virus 1 TaxID=2060617 RepID=A0A2P0VMS0_9VIRU|nr:putative galactose-binding domain-containing protein [Tetraselmis virus 1]AUF82181.1 putative galactose-binding domain-containing protein [Tetraselmis virus 1]